MRENSFMAGNWRFAMIFSIILNMPVRIITDNVTPFNIAQHNYPVQEHTVHTSDGYLINIYRIPALTQPHPTGKERTQVVLLQHGFTLTSDVWLLRDPMSDLPYLLADAGYDVWLGNHRGNKYGRRHSSLDPDTDGHYFWNFTWHEMGYYDLANTVDYILDETSQKALHYIGYSQGGLVALVLLTTRPEYASKFTSMQFTAPSVYMKNVQIPLLVWIGKVEQYLVRFMHWWGYDETLHFAQWAAYQRLCEALCKDGSWFRPIYLKLYRLVAGKIAIKEDYEHILPAVCGTLPAGASNKQFLHYIQLHSSGGFYQFNYGSADTNRRHYGTSMPPSYNLSAVQNCITIYYSDTDFMCTTADVQQLAKELHCVELYQLPHVAWNHGDFVWSRHARKALHERVIDKINWWNKGV